jgi:hypothetical protein
LNFGWFFRGIFAAVFTCFPPCALFSQNIESARQVTAMKNLVKLFAFALFLGLVVFPISAFASSSSQPALAGEAAVPISGWEISNLDYQLSDNSSVVKGVTFDLDAPAEQVAVKLVASSQEFAACTNTGGYHWQCNFHAGIKLSSMDEFRVIAAGD